MATLIRWALFCLKGIVEEEDGKDVRRLVKHGVMKPDINLEETYYTGRGCLSGPFYEKENVEPKTWAEHCAERGGKAVSVDTAKL